MLSGKTLQTEWI